MFVYVVGRYVMLSKYIDGCLVSVFAILSEIKYFERNTIKWITKTRYVYTVIWYRGNWCLSSFIKIHYGKCIPICFNRWLHVFTWKRISRLRRSILQPIHITIRVYHTSYRWRNKVSLWCCQTRRDGGHTLCVRA